MKNKILLIGGCGYLGSKLFLDLKEKNRVDTVDLEWFGNRVNPHNIKKDYRALQKKFLSKYNAVILLAGHSTVGMCEHDATESFKNNVEGFIALLQNLKKQKFIYASTYRLYYGAEKAAKEADECRTPATFYDLTKKTIDYYADLSSVEFYSLRMATVNGYSPNLRYNQIVNKLFIDAKTKEAMHIYNPYSFFSLLGISDLSRAVEAILLGKDKRGIYNLASFSSNVKTMSKKIQSIVPGSKISLEKSVKTAYHIRISTSKFEKTYRFAFNETLDSVLASLSENYRAKSKLIKSL